MLDSNSRHVAAAGRGFAELAACDAGTIPTQVPSGTHRPTGHAPCRPESLSAVTLRHAALRASGDRAQDVGLVARTIA